VRFIKERFLVKKKKRLNNHVQYPFFIRTFQPKESNGDLNPRDQVRFRFVGCGKYNKKSAKQLQAQYARLVSRLGKVGLVLQGTITERKIVRMRKAPKDPSKEKTYGHYY